MLAQFDVDQFRPPGWFCAGIGVLLLLLQLAVFRGECSCSNFEDRSNGLSLALIVKKLRKNQVKIFCTVGVSILRFINYYCISVTVACYLLYLNMGL